MPLPAHNGEPGCKTLGEIKKRFRHNWDPTAYWECGLIPGQRAQKKRCAANELYSDKSKSCVNWKDWEWSEPQEPPSRPDN